MDGKQILELAESILQGKPTASCEIPFSYVNAAKIFARYIMNSHDKFFTTSGAARCREKLTPEHQCVLVSGHPGDHSTGAPDTWTCSFCVATNTIKSTFCLKCLKQRYGYPVEPWKCICGETNSKELKACRLCRKEWALQPLAKLSPEIFNVLTSTLQTESLRALYAAKRQEYEAKLADLLKDKAELDALAIKMRSA